MKGRGREGIDCDLERATPASYFSGRCDVTDRTRRGENEAASTKEPRDSVIRGWEGCPPCIPRGGVRVPPATTYRLELGIERKVSIYV